MRWNPPLRIIRETFFAQWLVWVLLILPGVATAGSPIGSDPIWLGNSGNTLFFIAQPASSTPAGSAALFSSDGTTAGTKQLAQIDGVGVLTYQAGPLFLSAGTKSYFVANTTAAGQQVWVTDGSSTGTHQVTNILSTDQTYGTPILLGIIGTNLVFAQIVSDNTMQLFLTDGTAAGTTALSSFAQNQYSMVSGSIALNDKVYVALESGRSCCTPDLWATDGTVAGTVMIDSNEGFPTFHLQPSAFEPFGQSVALLTDTENQGVQLSTVDTATNALTILGTSPPASYGSTIAAMDGFILYLSGSPNSGQQLWRSDGTLAGTSMVAGLGTGVQFSQLGQDIVMTRVGNHAVFQAENTQIGPQLWGSDGTAQGTVPLIATPLPAASGAVQPLLGVAGTHGYYAVYNGTDFRVVVTDGTVAGTHVLTAAGPIDENSLPGDSDGGSQVVAGDDTLAFLYIYHFDAAGNSKHLYAYSPQTNTLTHLQDNGVPDVAGEPMLAYGGRLYFRGGDPVHSDNPWVSDGTVAGTHILVNLSSVAPVAGNDSASSDGDAAATIDVLANDSEPGGTLDTTSVQIVSAPTHGSASVTSSGSVVYTPTSGYSGSDSFSYTVKDLQGALSNVATVNVTVDSTSSSGSSGSSGGGGGGAVALLELLSLGALALVRRTRGAESA
ncbi:MAG: cadherin-like domain-containing protein [Proteobacteria bacterium]|nr:cadherin-like domain-containing protein [Pseudomonadota bacterium]